MQLFVSLFDNLFKDSSEKKEKIEELRMTGIATILLHDIGHGPLSHASEEIFGFKHEILTNEIIETTEIKDILGDANIESTDIRAIISRTSIEHKLVSQLISSQLDVDRLDYLARDAYFTGVEFSIVDLQRIIHTMQIYDDGSELAGYAITSLKGKGEIESYILARHLMYQGVYFHKTTRCIELMIKKLFERAKDLENTLELPDEIKFLHQGSDLNHEDLFFLDDHVLYNIILKWCKAEDNILRDLASRIINRKPLKSIDIDPGKFKKCWDKIDLIKKVLTNNNFDPNFYLLSDDPSDTPYYPYSPRGADDKTNVITNIFILDREGNPKEISRLSPTVRALSEEQHNFRIYIPSTCEAETLKYV